jgi:hypothetical protein
MEKWAAAAVKKNLAMDGVIKMQPLLLFLNLNR